MRNLSNFSIIALDTNIFIYYLNRTSIYHSQAEELFKKLQSGEFKAVTSILTLTELLSFSISEQGLKILERYFSDIPNTKLMEVNFEIATKAAKIRREQGIKLVDSIQLATALSAKAQVFITNDQKLKQFKKLEVLLLEQI